MSIAAFEACGDPDRFPDAGEPWQPLKLYYSHGFSKARIVAFHEALLARGPGVAVGGVAREVGRPRTDPGTRVTTRVRCGEYFAVRDQALLAHATQIDPNGRWFQMPLEMQQRVWPTEDYELARSLVGDPAETESAEDGDLFAGVRERVLTS